MMVFTTNDEVIIPDWVGRKHVECAHYRIDDNGKPYCQYKADNYRCCSNITDEYACNKFYSKERKCANCAHQIDVDKIRPGYLYCKKKDTCYIKTSCFVCYDHLPDY